MGVRGVDTGELLLDDVHVPAENVIGEVGGFRLAMLGLNAMRPIVAARGIGLAEGALMYATEYVKQRAAFGKTIADFQGIQWEIAKCAVDIEAARLLTYRAAVLADQGKFGKEYVPYLSMAKYHATELAVRASGLAVQLLGAAGYMEDHPTEQWYRDAKQLTIVEGTSQVQLGLIARGVLDRRPLVGLSCAPDDGGWPAAGCRRRRVADHRAGRGHAARRCSPARPRRRKSARSSRCCTPRVRRSDEVTGLARAMVDAAVPCPLAIRGRPSSSTWSAPAATGSRSINVSTSPPFITAGAGVPGVQARQPGGLVVGRDGRRARGAGRGHRARAGGRGPLRGRGRHGLLLRPALPPGHALRGPGAQGAGRADGVQLPGPAGQPGPARGTSWSG